MVNPGKLVRKLDLSALASVLNVGENREAWAKATMLETLGNPMVSLHSSRAGSMPGGREMGEGLVGTFTCHNCVAGSCWPVKMQVLL